MRPSLDSANAQNRLGMQHVDAGRYDKAVECFRRAVKLDPNFAVAHCNLGGALVQLGRYDKAAAAFRQALRVRPDLAEAHHNLGVVLRRQRRLDEAIASIRRALKLKPDYASAHNNLGATLAEAGRHEEAIASYRRTLELNPGLAAAHNNLGNALKALGRLEEAEQSYLRALRLDPGNAETYHNLGLTLRALRRLDQAVECFNRAVALRPDLADAHVGLGVALCDLRRGEEAIACFSRALALEPDNALALAHRLFQQACICDWGAIEADRGRIAALGVAGAIAPPFALLPLEDEPMRHRARAERFAQSVYAKTAAPSFARPSSRPERLRIGYFSADFSDHATMHLMARLFETHDRARFSVNAYSYGPEDASEMRRRAERAFDAFRDVRALSDSAIAELARQDQLDIAVDLKGYTEQNRLGVFAHGAAPIQISYLGYPGTLGAPFIDYLVADAAVVPPEERGAYAEKIIYLPHTYQANDNTRLIPERAVTRAQCGLPETGFVFCCFNNSFKLSPREFDVWMELLRRVDGAVLWLLSANARAEANLRSAAAERGVDPARLLFAPKVPQADHLARHRLADLFLDTFAYNAHTTASDALWAGLPLITTPGRGFAARVANSLLRAIGMEELIAADAQRYAELALELAANRDRLGDIRATLQARRASAPLFDSERFARALESGYEQAYARYLEGRPAADIWVEDAAGT